jgi:hypothetical protein
MDTSMSQILDLSAYANDIDHSQASFNLSACMGGWESDNDTVLLSIDFLDYAYETVGNRMSMAPVVNYDRGGITSLLFREMTGMVPVSTRFIKITANTIGATGPWNDGSADDIRLELNYV